MLNLSGQGVRCFEKLRELVRQDVRVDLCRRDIGMAQQCLDASRIGATHEQVSCISVPQRVRVDSSRADTGFQCQGFEQLSEAAPGEMS